MARVLVVDDVKFIVQMIAGEFSRLGHSVETAADGDEALVKAFIQMPDLVVTDLSMPKLDGLALTRLLRADSRTCDVPILLVTSRTDRATLESAAEVGIDDHLPKPFESSALLDKATALLGGYPMTFSLRLLAETAIVTALPQELGASAAALVKPALSHAAASSVGPIVLDLSRTSRIDVQVGEALMSFVSASHRSGGAVIAVRPRLGVGVRAFLGEVGDKIRLYDDLATASAALQLAPDSVSRPLVPERKPREAPEVIKEDPVADAQPAAAAVAPQVTRMGAARGVVVEVHPQATIMRVTRPDLDAEVLTLLHEEVSRGPRALLLELPAILSLDERQVREVISLTAVAAATGASLRFVNPDEGVEVALRAAGLAAVVLRTRLPESAVTKSSS